jgi:hypothetical protein
VVDTRYDYDYSFSPALVGSWRMNSRTPGVVFFVFGLFSSDNGPDNEGLTLLDPLRVLMYGATLNGAFRKHACARSNIITGQHNLLLSYLS